MMNKVLRFGVTGGYGYGNHLFLGCIVSPRQRSFVSSPKRSPEEVTKLLNRYSRFKQTPVSLRHLLEIGGSNELESFKFLRGELPTRLCHTIVELESIPGYLVQQPSVKEICQKYRQSFLDLLDLPSAREISKISSKKQIQTLKDFSSIIKRILLRHADVTATMGMGILELKHSGTTDEEEMICLRDFLDRFYMGRIGLRTHMEQHLHTYEEKINDNYVGIFSVNCDVKDVAEQAVDYAANLCRQNYCDAPPVKIHTPLGLDPIVYSPSHIHYIMTEVLKNSMRAVVEFYGDDELQYPSIDISIIEKDKEIVIKVSDKGGGIPQRMHGKLFSYSFSTANQPDLRHLSAGDTHFAGFGYGLALSRLHARYLGGDMTICPMHGYGTDVYIHIRNFDTAHEVLPSLDRATLKKYETSGDRIPNLQNWMESGRQHLNNRKIRPDVDVISI